MDRFARDDISASKLACVFVLTAFSLLTVLSGAHPLTAAYSLSAGLALTVRVAGVIALSLIVAWFGAHRTGRYNLALAFSSCSFAAIGVLMVCAGAAHAEVAGVCLLIDLFGCAFLVLNALDARHDAALAGRLLSTPAELSAEVQAARRALGVDANGRLP